MSKARGVVLSQLGFTLTAVIVGTFSYFVGVESALAADPPEGQSYVGSKTCASCHFEQFMTWKKSKHSKTFDLLPDKFKTDAKCLKCHTAGYGEPTGFKDVKTTPNLVGTSCENCHGPGSKHAETCQAFGKKKLTEEEEKIARDSIWLMTPNNACVKCHKTQAHHESETPKELRTKK